ncbi:MAG: terminase family protein, partial [Devosiaceae bacterium]|nr:terminase family protein [Devosiaceae bacterium]
MPPPGNWATWLIMGGRGSGKTRAGAEWVRRLATKKNAFACVNSIALVGETMAEARAVMVEGPAGLLSIGPVEQRPVFDRSRNILKWPSGVVAQLMSASEPDRFRGPQFGAAWCDEVAKWPNGEAAWDMLQFGLRLGDQPRQMVTTTPKPTPLLKRIIADKRTTITRMATRDNKANLAKSFLSEIVGRYEGTFLGRQELDGELIEDLPGSLWGRAALQAIQTDADIDLQRVIVSVDPAVSS